MKTRMKKKYKKNKIKKRNVAETAYEKEIENGN